MKKWVIGFLIVCIIGISSIYIFIPSKIVVSSISPVKAFTNAAGRFLANPEKIKQCLHSFATKNDSTFTYKELDFNISRLFFNGLELNITEANSKTISKLVVLGISTDSSMLFWSTELPASLNPVNRITEYNHAKKIKEGINALLAQFQHYLSDHVNLYNFAIDEIQLKDSVLISTKITTAAEPTVNEIYLQIKKLSDYATSQHAVSTNFPMLHSIQTDATHFETMVGLPISKLIAETGDIHIKRMPYNGNMFVTEIKGGPKSIQNGFTELGNFLSDSKRASPAIPYELLITNRQQQPDTTKWVTKLYYPVM
jgi:hypothetical protein